MKTRPILFNGDMVRALLAGRKTQTRRLVKPQPKSEQAWRGWVMGSTDRKHEDCASWAMEGIGRHSLTDAVYARPPCQKGDMLWVRETTESHEHETFHAALSCYSADGSPVLYSNSQDPEYNGSWAHWNYPRKSRPSIHMPRWASRLTLRITDVRVERLQEISEEDAKAEGCDNSKSEEAATVGWYEKPRKAFRRLWEHINGSESWSANPWVWVIKFEVIQANVDTVLKQEAA